MNHIINADDFGINENVSKAICESILKGLCSNTTLMVNMPYASQAVELAKANNFSDKVGLHLNLTEGIPLTSDIREIGLFCDENGEFCKMPGRKNLKGRFVINKKYHLAITKEIEAQMQKYIEFKLPQMHLDSHHHVHTDYAIIRLVKPLFKKYGFKTLRMSKNLGNVDIINKVYKFLYNSTIQRTTDYFCSLDEFLQIQDKLMDKNCLMEIMVHPKYEDNIIMDANKSLEDRIKRIKNLKLVNYEGVFEKHRAHAFAKNFPQFFR